MGELFGILLWHAAPVILALLLWRQLRDGVIWVGFGVRSAQRATEPVAYWLGIAGCCFVLLLVCWIVGSADVAALQERGWL
ncbi:hypothetical protein [Phenylobacterium sp. 58.2.17]|uniref:hypothetical protein n=1 Tax=Phenylobacterium sp. 58.2.17 TaxID=2969306 RepID=UPI00226500DD|nr:hypothetical protein [Phenylobacterium sp. 58.2.17]MCX7588100.1 hypothetical protein [Phenylobacterium sp. 58.2.17]